tara:strand:+ start:111 stop:314 length:204 start_codon:yes stop_codon:yes gene_type:complete
MQHAQSPRNERIATAFANHAAELRSREQGDELLALETLAQDVANAIFGMDLDEIDEFMTKATLSGSF